MAAGGVDRASWSRGAAQGLDEKNHRNMEDGEEEEEKHDCRGVRGARLPCSSR
jgi:hypothetical protein